MQRQGVLPLASAAPAKPSSQHVEVQALPSSSSFVTPCKRSTCSIEGVETCVILQEYIDRSFVIVTQGAKVGTVIQASLSTASSPYAPLSSSLGLAGEDGAEDELDPQASSHSVSAGNEARIAAPLPNLVQSTLLGSAPPGYRSIYTLYASSIFSILRPGPRDPLDSDAQQEKDPRPVVIALNLRRVNSNATAAITKTQDGDEIEDVEALADSEGPRFRAVLTLIRQCLEER